MPVERDMFPTPGGPPQESLPAGAHALARLLVGQPTAIPQEVLPEPWAQLVAAVAAVPQPERTAVLTGQLLQRPDARALLQAVMAVDPLRPEPKDFFLIPATVSESAPVALWPEPLAEAALHGLAGDFVRLIESHTEADPAGLLVQFLVAFGSAIGRSAYFVAEKQRHYANLFAVLVGRSSKGRKGSSWSQVQHVFAEVAPGWLQSNVKGGLSSGEGLISAVRDPLGDVPGVSDKRLLAKEEEFAAVLRVLRREGNTLSALLRQAWDSGALRTLTRGDPLVATDAHISVLGHITADELRRLLTSTEAGNGFGNRFLWVCVRRVRSLPEGGQADDLALGELAAHVKLALDHASTATELRRNAEARELWLAVYEELAAGHEGLFGAVTGRAEAQVMRLALSYALLDLCDSIRLPHLEAALAVWRYCEASARYVFGDDSGDPCAELVRNALAQRPGGMTRNELTHALQRQADAAAVGHSLANLHERGLVEVQREATGGRPRERWLLRPPGSDSET